MTKIFISAGHDGTSTGVSGNGIQEHVLNLSVAKALEVLCLNANFLVRTARVGHERVTLERRTNLANAWGASILIDIHHNGHAAASARGMEIIYSVRAPESKILAERVQAEFVRQFPTMSNRGIKTRIAAGGRDHFHMLRASNARAAIITECGFISSTHDAAVLRRVNFPSLQAQAIFDGIMKYTAR